MPMAEPISRTLDDAVRSSKRSSERYTRIYGPALIVLFTIFGFISRFGWSKTKAIPPQNLGQPSLITQINHEVIDELKKCNPILKDIEIKSFAEPRKVYNSLCKIDFLGYKSSKLELYMIDHVKEFQGVKGDQIAKAQKKYCNFMDSEYVKSAVEEFLNAMTRYRDLSSFVDEKVNTDIFSTMTYRTACQDGVTEVNTHYIEPLLGLTRHPYALCKDESWLMKLDYILIQSFQDNLFYKRMNKTRQIQYVGMDLGAST